MPAKRFKTGLVLATAILMAAVAEGAPGHGGAVPRLYVTNSLGDTITVIDLGKLKKVGQIKVGMHVHGICAPADGRTLFTTIESEHSLKIIDTRTNRITGVVHLDGKPNQCAVTPDGRYVAVPIRSGGEVDIVDARLQKIVKSFPIKVPHNCFDADSNKDVWVSSMGSDEVDRINLRTMQYSVKVPVGGVPRPYAITKDERRMYVALSDFHGFAVVDVPTRRVIERVSLPPAPESHCVLEPRTPTHGLALSPDEHELWVTSLADGLVYVYAVPTNELLGKVAVGECPNWIAFSPDGRYVCISNSGSDNCSIIDTRTRREVARIKTGKGPKRLLVVDVPVD